MNALRRWLDRLLGVPLIAFLRIFSPKSQLATNVPKKVLVIKLAAMGDTVLMVPVLRQLRAALPGSEIDWLISNTNRELAETVPYVSRTIVLASFSPFAIFPLMRHLRDTRYDAVIDFEQWAKGTAVLSWLTRAPRRFGFDTPGLDRAGLYTQSLAKTYTHHELDDLLDLAKLLVPITQDHKLELWQTPEGESELQAAAPGLKTTSSSWRVLIHPGCGGDGTAREWPVERYAALGKWLQTQMNAEIFISGGPDDLPTGAAIMEKLPGAVNLTGRLRWQATVSLVQRMDCVISGNTGIMHIAAALGKNQVALHGPTNFAIWGPLNPKAVVIQTPCPHCPCLRLGYEYHRKTQECMALIPLQEVQEAVAAFR